MKACCNYWLVYIALSKIFFLYFKKTVSLKKTLGSSFSASPLKLVIFALNLRSSVTSSDKASTTAVLKDLLLLPASC